MHNDSEIRASTQVREIQDRGFIPSAIGNGRDRKPSKLSNSKSPRQRDKSNEEVIREELRAIGTGYLKVWQSGVALLPALMLALFYFRRETVQNFVAAGKIQAGQMLPLDIYLIGTFFVTVVCAAF